MTLGSIAAASREPARSAELCALIKERMDRGAIELPLLPVVTTRVMQICADEGDTRELLDVIRSSAEMTAHVFRWANSPLYRPRTAIVSLQQAVCRLGVRPIRDIALIVACKTRLFRAPGFDAELRFVFRHSLVTAFIAQEIARLKRTNVEEAFLGGLLHHIGRPLLFQTIVDIKRERAIAPSRTEIFSAVDILHATCGARLASAWKLPPGIVDVIAHHHHPDSADNPRLAGLVLFAADVAHHVLEPGAHPQREVRGHPMLETLSLYPDEVDALLARGPAIAAMVERAP